MLVYRALLQQVQRETQATTHLAGSALIIAGRRFTSLVPHAWQLPLVAPWLLRDSKSLFAYSGAFTTSNEEGSAYCVRRVNARLPFISGNKHESKYASKPWLGGCTAMPEALQPCKLPPVKRIVASKAEDGTGATGQVIDNYAGAL